MRKLGKALAVTMAMVITVSGISFSSLDTISADGVTNEVVDVKLGSVGGLIPDKAIGSNGFIGTDGTLLRKNYGQGELINLRGVVATNYMIQLWGYTRTLFGGDSDDMHSIMNILYQRDDIGPEKAEELFKVYTDSFWTEKDFDKCVEYGINCIKLPVWYGNFTDDEGNLKANAFDTVDWFINEAKERGIYVILDMSGAYGSQNGLTTSGIMTESYEIDNFEFFYGNKAEKNQKLMKDLWKTIAERYKDEPAIAGYGILDKPISYLYEEEYLDYSKEEVIDYVNSVMDELYDSIREVDKNHMLIMCSMLGTDCMYSPDVYGWTNVMYEYTVFDFESFDETEQLVADIDNSNYGVPAMMGESIYSDISLSEKALQLFNENNINWMNWGYKCSYTIDDSDYQPYTNENMAMFYIDDDVEYVDVTRDSYETIYESWSRNDECYENVDMIELVKKYAGESNYEMSQDLTIEGFQLNTNIWGLRTVASVEPEINDKAVVEYGNIYGNVTGDMTEEDVYLDKISEDVVAYKSSVNGELKQKVSESQTAINYVFTLANNGYTKEAYTQEYLVRPYAILEGGAIIYGQCSKFSIYEVAGYMYDNCIAKTADAHTKIHNEILSVVNKDYNKVEYLYSGILYKPNN